MSHISGREDRRFEAAKKDQRSRFARDRDRILYCSAFRRLGGVTQIVRAGESDVFHNRLTHTMKVAQLGLRIAQNVTEKQPQEAAFHDINADVVEAACLAHDLGHPPFGHMGEYVLNSLVLGKPIEGKEPRWKADENGFEGNAQSFRVITKLAVRFSGEDGLDLTRATLGAVIKYPWKRDPDIPSQTSKWGYYEDDLEDFEFARVGFQHKEKTAEAEIMDWADDIAYSVHDLEDFHRCGAIPWARIFPLDPDRDPVDLDRMITNVKEKWYGHPSDADGRLRRAHERLSKLITTVGSNLILEPYEGTREQRQKIRLLTSQLIGRYLPAIRLSTEAEYSDTKVAVAIDQKMSDEVRLLKQIARDYIISSSALAGQQKGQKRILQDLFQDIYDDISSDKRTYLPKRFHHLCESGASAVRATADCIASLTENEAYALHARFNGYAAGSVLDPIVR
ncbi:deoxyguanosinetriphosphate triphosphohydrolase family protein [Agrobacterium cavarae]|uniref:deoxyguanosinetriphosphate triphosphohydrolase family protein n=1 Tax=Agrobacterium cavarae TaxID=2528239 RepID=UPI003EE650AA